MKIKVSTLSDDDSTDMSVLNNSLELAPLYSVGASPELIKLYEEFKAKLDDEFEFE